MYSSSYTTMGLVYSCGSPFSCNSVRWMCWEDQSPSRWPESPRPCRWARASWQTPRCTRWHTHFHHSWGCERNKPNDYPRRRTLYVCMSQLLGSEVERQGKARLHQDSSFFERRVALGGIRTHRHSAALYIIIYYQGNSAYNNANTTTKAHLKPLYV